jgi:hypothetical protein
MSILTSLDWTRFSFDVLCIEDQVCERCGERGVRRERWRESAGGGVGGREEGSKGGQQEREEGSRRERRAAGERGGQQEREEGSRCDTVSPQASIVERLSTTATLSFN